MSDNIIIKIDGDIMLDNGKIVNQWDLPKVLDGIPIFRKVKDIGLGKLPKQVVIIFHETGLKLFKNIKGYIILCTEKDCTKAGGYIDIKCNQHAVSYSFCTTQKCNKRASFGNEWQKSLKCSEHKLKNMVNVVSKRCEFKGCKTIPIYGYENDGRGIFCKIHKSEDMIDVKNKRCEFKGCITRPSYGYENVQIIRFCKTHKMENMIDLKHKKCEFRDCRTIPIYGYITDQISRFCKIHKLKNMVDVVSKRCEFKGCIIRPSYGYENDQISRFCKMHKLENMLNVISKRCEFKDCIIRPSYGYENDQISRFCKIHKKENMIDLKHKKCEFKDCKTIPIYGYITDQISRFCKIHKLENMVNIQDKKCKFEGCETLSSYKKLYTTGKIHCLGHATLNEYSKRKNNPICTNIYCINRAYFYNIDDTNIYPSRCSDHKLNTDIELVFKQCQTCSDSLYFPINKENCMECGQYRTKKLIKFKETQIKEFLYTNEIKFINDKRISNNGSKYRPDFLLEMPFGYLIIEVDEHQHKKDYIPENENIRMMTIYNDIQLISPSSQVVFIRYNPDNYTSEFQFTQKERMNYLYTIIKYYMNIKKITYNSDGVDLCIRLVVVYLYYDGYIHPPREYNIEI